MKDIYIARQAIYNRKMGVFAYELLYRSSATNQAPKTFDGTIATTEVLLNAFVEIGIVNLVGRHKAFINLPQSYFINPTPMPFEPGQVVLEILENLEVDDQLIQAVKDLKAKGYTLALDDYVFEPRWDPIIKLVDIVKVEITGLSRIELEIRCKRLRTHGPQLLAEKVETHEDYELCRDLGFEYFQGFFFSRPKIVQGRKLDDNQMVVLKLLQKLNDAKTDINEIGKLIAQDVGLSYKVLRYVNSAAVGLRQKIESIQRAIFLMGLGKIRAWASLMAMSGIKGKSTVLLNQALVRAMMCEALVRAAKVGNPESAFTAGLFSMLDVMLDQTMAVVLNQLPLSDDIQDAILHGKGPIGEALACALAYEQHDWDRMVFPGLDKDRVQVIYWDVVILAEESSLFGEVS